MSMHQSCLAKKTNGLHLILSLIKSIVLTMYKETVERKALFKQESSGTNPLRKGGYLP